MYFIESRRIWSFGHGIGSVLFCFLFLQYFNSYFWCATSIVSPQFCIQTVHATHIQVGGYFEHLQTICHVELLVFNIRSQSTDPHIDGSGTRLCQHHYIHIFS